MTRELAHRVNSGIEVALMWECGSRDVTVVVRDASSGDAFTVTVDGAHALDAFNHPYAYAGRRGDPQPHTASAA